MVNSRGARKKSRTSATGLGVWGRRGWAAPHRAGAAAGEAFLGKHLAHRGGAQRRSLLLERLTDLVDRIVALAQRDDLLLGTAFLGLWRGPGPRGGEEVRQFAVAKRMAEHAEGAWRVAEAAAASADGSPSTKKARRASY